MKVHKELLYTGSLNFATLSVPLILMGNKNVNKVQLNEIKKAKHAREDSGTDFHSELGQGVVTAT